MTHIQLDIRPFRIADKDAVVELWREVFPGEPPWSEPGAIIQRKLAYERQPFLVAVQKGAIVGTVLAGYDRIRGWIYHLAVASSMRRAGIARRLMMAAEEQLRALGCHHALATINEVLYRQKMEDVLEVDIRDFFGSLSHEWLMRFLELRIGDGRVLTLIQAWLRAGIFEEGRWQEVERGTPQGGSISPLLANIYLHYVVDLRFERKIKPQFRGQAALVRYADDCVPRARVA